MTMASSCSSNCEDMPELEEESHNDGVDWDDSGDDETMELPHSKCLFCDGNFPTPQVLFSHCKTRHGFDILLVNRIHQLDCFSYIKLINYIREEKPSPTSFGHDAIYSGSQPWGNDSYMRPVLEDDSLLLFDVEELSEITPNESDGAGPGNAPEEVVEIPVEKYRLLLGQVRLMETRAERAETDLQQAMTDLANIRLAASSLVMSAPAGPSTSSEAIQNLQLGDDDAYIDSYSHFGIHQEMLQDKVRTESYRDCMYKNREYFKDKVVLDVGCGTGILSMFAARAGAKLVIGVDMSDIIYQATDIVRENGLEDKITLLKGRMEDVDLPVEKVDIIISEWMGYCLLYESMLDSVLWARDRYLAADGIVLPDHCDMRFVGVADDKLHHNNIKYWDDVYGFKMTCMRNTLIQEASVTVVDRSKIVTSCCVFKDLDVCKCSTKDLEFNNNVELEVERDCEITAFVAYFDINFRLPNKVTFSTGPQATATHWKQTVFILEKPIPVTKGQVLKGHFLLRKNPKDPRSCKVTLNVEGNSTTWSLS